jgi:hypothetical protein
MSRGTEEEYDARREAPMVIPTREMPVLRAYARFSWTSGDSQTTDYGVGLYSNGAVSLDSMPSAGGLVAELQWIAGEDAIGGGSWSSTNTWDEGTRKHLLSAATNVLRRQMGLAPRE